MKSDRNNDRINTTLGELIAAVSEVAFETAHNSKNAYRLARLVLVRILKRATPRNNRVDGQVSEVKHLQ